MNMENSDRLTDAEVQSLLNLYFMEFLTLWGAALIVNDVDVGQFTSLQSS